MPIEYEQSTELSALVEELLDDEDFGHLTSHGVTVTACMKIKMDADGEPVQCPGDAAQLKKVSSYCKVFIPQMFVIVFDSYTWHNFVGRRKAAIHKALMRIKVTTTDSGTVKVGTRPPEVQEFVSTLRRYGAYTEQIAAVMSAAEEINRMIR